MDQIEYRDRCVQNFSVEGRVFYEQFSYLIPVCASSVYDIFVAKGRLFFEILLLINLYYLLSILITLSLLVALASLLLFLRK